jgi:hypothetical protein
MSDLAVSDLAYYSNGHTVTYPGENTLLLSMFLAANPESWFGRKPMPKPLYKQLNEFYRPWTALVGSPGCQQSLLLASNCLARGLRVPVVTTYGTMLPCLVDHGTHPSLHKALKFFLRGFRMPEMTLQCSVRLIRVPVFTANDPILPGQGD